MGTFGISQDPTPYKLTLAIYFISKKSIPISYFVQNDYFGS